MDNLLYGDRYAFSLFGELKALVNEDDTDLMINDDHKVWVQNGSGEIRCIKDDFDNNKILPFGSLLATHYDIALNGGHPFLDCQIPYDNSRVHINIPPSSSLPTLAIRFHKENFRDLETLHKWGMFSEKQMWIMQQYIREKKNIIINGETGSGKSTLLSALLNEIPKDERVITIEDTKELTCNLPNITHLYTSNREVYDDLQAVRDTLRMNPHRIIYGEVRDGRATLELIKAWNTGHKGGLCTIHANTRAGDYIGGVRTRLLSLTNEVSSSPQNEAINEVLEVVIQIEVKNGIRRVVNIENVKNPLTFGI